MMHVFEHRPDDSRELALHLLQAIISFPQHWLGFSGWAMTTYYNDGHLALIRGLLKAVLKVLDESPSHKVKLLCIAVVTEFMASDDADVDRHTAIQLDPSFFIEPQSRSRCNTPSSASSQKSQRFAMFQRIRSDDYEVLVESLSIRIRPCRLGARRRRVFPQLPRAIRIGSNEGGKKNLAPHITEV